MFPHNTLFFPQSQLSPDGQAPGLTGYRKRKPSEPVEWSLTAPKVQMHESPRSKTMSHFLYVFGGDHAVHHKGDVERYKINPGEWENVATMPGPGVGVRVARFRGDIWVVGGFSREVYTFNKWQNQFIPQKKPMQHARQYPGLAELSGHLFAIGGENGDDIRRTVEMCRQHEDWSFADSLNTPRSDFGVVAFKNKIFVAGGKTSENTRTNSVETYTLNGRWTLSRRNMDIARSRFSLVVSGNSIYAVGGDENVSVSKSDDGEQWGSVPGEIDLERRRECGAAVSGFGIFYFVGGKRDGENTTYMDAFSKSTRSWKQLPAMNTARGGAAVLLVMLEE